MILPKSRERDLIRRAKAGEGTAIEAIIRAHQEALYAFLLRMSGRPDVAEDIAQEAFVRVLRNLDRFDPRFRFSTWLFTIAKRLYVNAAQKQRPTYDSDAINAWQGQSAEPPHISAGTETLDNVRDLVDVALGSLNPQQREIVLLFHQQSWPIIEIAAHLGMPEGTVKSHLHRARRRMRRWIMADARLLARAEEAW